MSNILLGLALISASLQTGWAVFADGQYLALPVAAIAITLGAKYLAEGATRRLYRA